MYPHQLTFDNLITLISGVLSLIAIIVFFVVAYRLRIIKNSAYNLNRVFRDKAISDNQLLPVKCPQCERINDFYNNDPKPLICDRCGANLSEKLPTIEKIQVEAKAGNHENVA